MFIKVLRVVMISRTVLFNRSEDWRGWEATAESCFLVFAVVENHRGAGGEWVVSVNGKQPTLPDKTSLEAAFLFFFTLKAELDCVFNIKMPLRFAVLLDDMLPVLIPTDWRLKAAVQSGQGGGSRELLAEPAATNHARQLECDKWMEEKRMVPPANLRPSPASKHFLRALNQMDFFFFFFRL